MFIDWKIWRWFKIILNIQEQREQTAFTKLDKQVCHRKILTIDKCKGTYTGRNTWNCSHTSLNSKSAVAIVNKPSESEQIAFGNNLLDTHQPTEKAYSLSGCIKNGAENKNEITMTLHKSTVRLYLECSVMTTELNSDINKIRDPETDNKNY